MLLFTKFWTFLNCLELSQLTGIAAILRFPMPELEDEEDDDSEESEESDKEEAVEADVDADSESIEDAKDFTS